MPRREHVGRWRLLLLVACSVLGVLAACSTSGSNSAEVGGPGGGHPGRNEPPHREATGTSPFLDPERRGPVDHTLATHAIPTSVETADGAGDYSEVAPGEIVVIEGPIRGPLQLVNFHGTPEDPIVFVNGGDVVTIDGGGGSSPPLAGIQLVDSTHVRITGTGTDGPQRSAGANGFQPHMDLTTLEGAQNAGIVIRGTQRGIRFKEWDLFQGEDPGEYPIGLEFDHLEIGPISKNALHGPHDEATEDGGIGPAFTLYGMRFHHLYIHDTDRPPHRDGEGMYIGPNDYYNHDKARNGQVEIDHNFVIRTGRDAVQLGGSWYGDNRVHHNVLADTGLELDHDADATTQRMTCIILNRGSVADVYSNWCFDSGHDGIYDQGLGGSRYWSNVIVNPGVRNVNEQEVRGLHISPKRSDASGEWSFHLPDRTRTCLWDNTVADTLDEALDRTVDPDNAAFHILFGVCDWSR